MPSARDVEDLHVVGGLTRPAPFVLDGDHVVALAVEVAGVDFLGVEGEAPAVGAVLPGLIRVEVPHHEELVVPLFVEDDGLVVTVAVDVTDGDVAALHAVDRGVGTAHLLHLADGELGVPADGHELVEAVEVHVARRHVHRREADVEHGFAVGLVEEDLRVAFEDHRDPLRPLAVEVSSGHVEDLRLVRQIDRGEVAVGRDLEPVDPVVVADDHELAVHAEVAELAEGRRGAVILETTRHLAHALFAGLAVLAVGVRAAADIRTPRIGSRDLRRVETVGVLTATATARYEPGKRQTEPPHPPRHHRGM